MQFAFGSGVFWATPLVDANGATVTNPTPLQLGVLQDFSFDISYDTKELYGQSQFPVAVGRGKAKMTLKAKVAQISGLLLGSIAFGQPITNSLTSDYLDLTGSTIPASPYSVSPTPPNSGTITADLGVRTSAGVPLTRVAATPATGQYTYASGIYTFAAADTGTLVYISYQYTATSATSVYQAVQNKIMGATPLFRSDIYIPYGTGSLVLTIPKTVMGKASFASKIDDFLIPEFDMTGLADNLNNSIYWSTTSQ